MKKILFVLCMLAAVVTCYATQQTEGNSARPEQIYSEVDEPASFPGGTNALFQWLSANIKYPASAIQNGLQGRVVVRFVVEKDGSITNCTIAKGVDKDLDAEALRLVKKMPEWDPAKKDGVAVRSYYSLPITFKMNH